MRGKRLRRAPIVICCCAFRRTNGKLSLMGQTTKRLTPPTPPRIIMAQCYVFPARAETFSLRTGIHREELFDALSA